MQCDQKTWEQEGDNICDMGKQCNSLITTKSIASSQYSTASCLHHCIATQVQFCHIFVHPLQFYCHWHTFPSYHFCTFVCAYTQWRWNPSAYPPLYETLLCFWYSQLYSLIPRSEKVLVSRSLGPALGPVFLRLYAIDAYKHQYVKLR